MQDYMLVMKGQHKAWAEFSADDKQRLMEKYYSFVNRLKREERFKGGAALKHGGSGLYSEKGIVMVDGPFAETKEALNGYFIFSARNEAEAIAIARDCPALTHGERVEIFQIGEH